MGEARRRKGFDPNYGNKTTEQQALEIWEKIQKNKPETYSIDLGLSVAAEFGTKRFNLRFGTGEYQWCVFPYKKFTGITVVLPGFIIDTTLYTEQRIITLEYPLKHNKETLDIISELLMNEGLEVFADWGNRYATKGINSDLASLKKHRDFKELVVPIKFTEKSLEKIRTAIAEMNQGKQVNQTTKDLVSSTVVEVPTENVFYFTDGTNKTPQQLIRELEDRTA
ncbi:hypothetical protein DSM106972_056510 [Dulcicalothrix desertica PCC 7102]|uniref:Uncharacterized protein n=1 Tax=Dulcicalothrix desertica PCC 7102 TaxID=232991 RepID=A0A3S1AK28_9CYAN|nr:hypothetical protein [Dulcicalothrix desertica]RUT02731.1 hypothetical protein DSM106972_056510 [Dulcicalothrix desertica PCC 7102]TWH39034.1 hypothetical protein CAL7102_08238 [Dulcicalothrix desertica PCC 7102]